MVTLLAFVIAPLAANMLAGSAARDAGLTGDGVQVSVNLLGPAILSGRAESVNVQGNNVNVPHGSVGHLDVTLGNVSLSDHTFSTVSGELTDLTLNGPGGPIVVGNVDLCGPSSRTRAKGTISAPEARKLVKNVAVSVGLVVESVQLKDGSLALVSSGQKIDASLRVAGGALVMDRPGEQPTVLFAPATSDAWQLQSVIVSAAGIQLAFSVDAASLAQSLGAGAKLSH